MSKITESSAPSNGPSFSPFPQNPNSPTGIALVSASRKTTFPKEISIESLVPYTPRGRKPLEAPIPPISTPKYTVTNGFNFGGIACSSEAPVFGRRIKVPRGLLVAPEHEEFTFVREKQCKLPMSPSQAIFTAGKPIKPLRKSLLLTKESEISFADSSVSPEVVFVRAGYGRIDGGDEVIQGLEDEAVGVSSAGLERSLSLTLKTPLLGDDEPHPEDVSLTHSLALNTPLPVGAEFGSELTLATPEIENGPTLGVGDDKPLVETPLDCTNARSTDSTIPTKAIFPIRKPVRQLRQPHSQFSKEPEIAFVKASVSRKVVFGGMGPNELGGRLEYADEVIGPLEAGAITLNSRAVTSAVTDEDLARYPSTAIETPLPDGDELCSQDASLSPSPALNTLALDTGSGSECPLLILGCESPFEADANGKPFLEAPRGIEVAGLPNSDVLEKDVCGQGDQEPKSIDVSDEQGMVGNTPPHNHSLSTKDLNLTLKANTTTTRYTFDLPSQKMRSASKTEAYGHCKIFKNPAIIPSTSTTTLAILPSDIVMGRGGGSSTHSEANTDPALVGFGETKFEFDLTDMFVGIFEEVGVVDLALSTITPSSPAGRTLPWSQDLQADGVFHGKQEAASHVDARSEVFAATSGVGEKEKEEKKKKKSAVQKAFAKLGKISVRENIIKLFNKLSPMLG